VDAGPIPAQAHSGALKRFRNRRVAAALFVGIAAATALVGYSLVSNRPDPNGPLGGLTAGYSFQCAPGIRGHGYTWGDYGVSSPASGAITIQHIDLGHPHHLKLEGAWLVPTYTSDPLVGSQPNFPPIASAWPKYAIWSKRIPAEGAVISSRPSLTYNFVLHLQPTGKNGGYADDILVYYSQGGKDYVLDTRFSETIVYAAKCSNISKAQENAIMAGK